ncbi:hypothetical protein AQ505_09575 [Pedobacter sp. PACM 27299]|nr:hypothetical protein AQ505_09575 [Pedobacter sp. PACM 27299]
MVLLAFETGATGLLCFKLLVSQAQLNRQKNRWLNKLAIKNHKSSYVILIFSINSDYSTSSVISWLIRLNKPFIRINEDTLLELLWLTSSDFAITINGKTVLGSQINKMWYRRGGLDLFARFKNILIKDYLRTEHTALIEYFYYRLDKIPSVNKFKNSDINKLYLMELCEQYGVLAPKYLVTGCKNTVANFFEQEKCIISKPISTPFSIQDEEDFSHMAYTSMVSPEDIDALPSDLCLLFFSRPSLKPMRLGFFT